MRPFFVPASEASLVECPSTELLLQLRQHLEQVTDQADVRHLENRRLRIVRISSHCVSSETIEAADAGPMTVDQGLPSGRSRPPPRCSDTRIFPFPSEMPAQPVLSLNPPVLHGGAGDNRMTKQSAHQIGLRRGPARIGRIGWLAVATQVIENPRNHCRFLDTGDHPQLPATAPTDLDVDREYAF